MPALQIYVASSWRNEQHGEVVAALREEGHRVYDYREPVEGTPGFSWEELEAGAPDEWSFDDYFAALSKSPARRGFSRDITAVDNADALVLVLPSGSSAHAEMSRAARTEGITTIIYFAGDGWRPDLMHLLADYMTDNLDTVRMLLRQQAGGAGGGIYR